MHPLRSLSQVLALPQPSRPPPAMIRPGRPTPTTGQARPPQHSQTQIDRCRDRPIGLPCHLARMRLNSPQALIGNRLSKIGDIHCALCSAGALNIGPFVMSSWSANPGAGGPMTASFGGSHQRLPSTMTGPSGVMAMSHPIVRRGRKSFAAERASSMTKFQFGRRKPAIGAPVSG